MTGCETKGFLSPLLLWILSKKSMTGAELACALQERKGTRPSPGTIYPALKDLKANSLVTNDRHKRYTLTAKGKKELNKFLTNFFVTFSDVDEMRRCCGKQ